jgi:elongation factor Ts
MAVVTAEMVKLLREATDAGVLDCKKALTENDGDFEKAADFLRKKGLAKAASKATRAANEGIIGEYMHSNNKMAALVRLNCETDFVARNETFQQLAREIAMQVAASRPLYVSREDVPAEEIAKEKEVYVAQMSESGKPAAVIERIVEGKLDKWFSEICLLEQTNIRNADVTIQQMLTDAIAKLGENIKIGGFSRLAIGE